ncbi:hypothetical protein GCM10027299_29110 [Larkinella ripae]
MENEDQKPTGKTSKLTLEILEKMHRGEIPMTKEGERWIEFGKSSAEFVKQMQNATKNIPGSLVAELTSMAKSNASMFNSVNKAAISPISSLYAQMMEQSKERAERFKLVAEQVKKIKSDSLTVYENEHGRYYIRNGLKVPYDKFWSWFLDKYQGETVIWVVENTNYDSLAKDFLRFMNLEKLDREEEEDRDYEELKKARQSPILQSESSQQEDEVNVFNGMRLEKVEEFFMQLATKYNSIGKPFLSKADVRKFINKAFRGHNNIPKLTLEIGPGETMAVKGLFYKYFQDCIHDYAVEPTKQCRPKYIALVVDNFTNFNKETLENGFNNSWRVGKKVWK